MHKTITVYDKRVYEGCSIVDVSEVRMLDSHCKTIHRKFNGSYDLLYIDTESMVSHFNHEILNKRLRCLRNEDEFDLSEMQAQLETTRTNAF